jgi:NDP-4-keto-2,6-dideoxyhexose 3-C-methyltransferase
MGVATIRTQCKLCESANFKEILNLGDCYLTNYVDPNCTANAPMSPLILEQCQECNLVQLKHVVPASMLYGGQYWYRSGMNKTMREHLTALAETLHEESGLYPGDVVVDIGCNDGTFLRNFPESVFTVGFEPSENVAKLASASTVFLSMFDPEAYWGQYSVKAQLVTAIAMFYDVEDPVEFCRGVKNILADNGTFVIQMNDLFSMVANNTFDIVCHEHLYYYPLGRLVSMLKGVGLEIYRVEHNDLNGGSLRAFMGHEGMNEIEASVQAQMETEGTALSDRVLENFTYQTGVSSMGLWEFVQNEILDGGKVYVYGASTRGNTILAAANLDNQFIAGAAEIHPDKIGLVTAGTRIPIVSEEEARANASAMIVLPYSYRAEFIEREREFIEKGGKLVFPLPEFEVVTDVRPVAPRS